MWGGLRQDRRGCIIAGSLFDQQLVVLNDGAPTFLRWSGGALRESTLDLVICSNDLADQLVMSISLRVEVADSGSWGVLLGRELDCCLRRGSLQVGFWREGLGPS